MTIDEIPDVGVKRLFSSVIIQAIKDYKLGIDNLQKRHLALSTREWVEKKFGTFDLCAQALNMTSETLQEIMLKKMKDLDKGELLKKYK